MRLRYSLTALAVALLALPAAAQDYGVLTQDQLDAVTGATDVEPRCIYANNGSILFYDSAGGNVLLYNTSSSDNDVVVVGVLISKADIDAAAGFEVDRCHAIAFQSEGGVARTFFAFGNGTDEAVLLFDGDGDTLSRLVAPAQAAGTYALAASGSTLYLGRVEFRGAPEDGVYSVSTTGADQTPAVVVQNPALDLLDLDVAADGSLYAVSSEFGQGEYQNVVARVADPAGTPVLSVAFAPCAGASPVFVDCGDGGVEEIQIATVRGAERLLVSNNAFTSDVVVVAFDLNGTNPETVFSGNALLDDDDVMETTFSVAFDNYLSYDEAADRLYIAARARADADAEAIYFADNVFGTPAEPLAPADGYALDLANPVRGGALVRVTLPAAETVRLVAYDALGRVAAVLADGPVSPGARVAFDAGALAPGVYVLRLTTEAGALARTVTVVR